jgi:hypothetical protein
VQLKRGGNVNPECATSPLVVRMNKQTVTAA